VKPKLSDVLEKMRACEESLRWVRNPRLATATAAERWDACARGDFMGWLADRIGLADKCTEAHEACANAYGREWPGAMARELKSRISGAEAERALYAEAKRRGIL
jgi:hypothetical protein